MSTQLKNKYAVRITEVKTHYYQVEAHSDEEARQLASDQFSDGKPGYDAEDHIFVAEDDVLLVEDEEDDEEGLSSESVAASSEGSE